MNVAIVGSGFSGTALAVQLLRRSPEPLRILLFERTGEFGAGLAYSTDAPEHLLNVPASKMSALPEAPSHFSDWLRENRLEGHEPPEHAFVSRRYYRRYLQDLLQETVHHPLNRESRLEKLDEEVVSIDRGYEVRTASGKSYVSDVVVLATGYQRNSNLYLALGSLAGYYRAYEPETWPASGVSDVVIVGSRLTAIDATLSVFARYPEARVTLVSRYGYLPGLHDVMSPAYRIELPNSLKSTRQLVGWVREEIRRADEAGVPWQSVFDAMRPKWESIWQGLSIGEQRRFLSHVLRNFDRFRHRISPAAAHVLLPHFLSGSVRIVAGCVHPTTPEAGGVLVGEAGGKTTFLPADLALDCSGASMSWVRGDEPLYRRLFAEGLVTEGPHGMGLAADAQGRLIDRAGKTGSLFAIGPMLRGVRWETTAVHELRHQAEDVAREIIAACVATNDR